MSRLGSMSPAAIRALFAQESDDTLMTLVTLYDPLTSAVAARLVDNFTQRLSETDTEVIYGTISNSEEYIFVPLEITLPSEEQDGSSRASLVIRDVTRYLTPIIRTLPGPPKIKIELVLKSTPDVVEATFTDFFISSINYNSDSVTCDLSLIDYQVEPFPVYSFTPKFFPGLF